MLQIMMDESVLRRTVVTIYLSIEHKLTVFATVWGKSEASPSLFNNRT